MAPKSIGRTPGCELDVGFASDGVKVGVDKLLIEGDIGWGRVDCGLLVGKRSNFIGTDCGIDRGLNGDGSGERKHEGGWGGEIVGENNGCLG